MKKIIVVFFVIFAFVGCKEPKGFVAISGKINDTKASEIIISSRNYSKTIKLDKHGKFKDTLKVKKGVFKLTDGENKLIVFLDNGYNLKLNSNADFTDVKFKGKGKETNNYIGERVKLSLSKDNDPKSFFTVSRDTFDIRVKQLEEKYASFSTKNVDSTVISQLEREGKQFITYLKRNYESKYAALIKFKPGTPSPKFTNYENYNGGKTSLDDFKGKYVYIDVWATWCGPCIQQIPFLKKIEKEYHDKNIEFVSISTDRPNKYETWKKMIKDKNMTGVQLYAGQDYSFSRNFDIRGIPRFILIDPQGNIVDANAPRPSDPRLKELFKTLDL